MLNIHPESQQDLDDGFENCFPLNFRIVYENISGSLIVCLSMNG